MAVSCRTLIDWLEAWAPPLLAESWDHIGLQVGSPATGIERVLVTLEITPQVIAEAVSEGVQLIVTHHPLIYDPLPNLDYDSFPASLVVRLIENRVHVYAAHTNMDAAAGGVNDLLAERLGLIEARALRPAPPEKLYKLVVFVPRGHEGEVRQAICEAGAGYIGNYSECTFQSDGTGAFRPLQGAHPFLGQVGELEQAEEIRLETVVPGTRLKDVIRAMLAAHPYEEVAYDLYRLQNRGEGKAGLGRVGRLPAPVPLGVYAGQVREALGLQAVRLAGDPDRVISSVALCGGGAMSMLRWALEADADVYVTGDVKHHEALNALGRGIAVIDAGHHATERMIVPAMAAYLTRKAAGAGEALRIITSKVNTDPLFTLLPDPEIRPKKPSRDDITTRSPEASAASVAAKPISRTGEAGCSPAMTTGKIIVFIDGASRGNPGNAGAGAMILNEQRELLIEKKKYLGSTTNNSAEYQALILALQEAVDMGANQVEIYTDSELLARQWSGRYRVQNSSLASLMQQARCLAGQLQSCKVAHIPRTQNKRADALANLAIDEHFKHPASK